VIGPVVATASAGEPSGARRPREGAAQGSGAAPEILTVGHGTLAEDALGRLLASAGVALVTDVRSVPGSRRHPHVGRAALETWLPEAGIEYRWEPRLGGFRRPSTASPNVALRHPSFRGYADYMETVEFSEALDGLVEAATRQRTVVMCAESLWWRCHRRLVADALTLLAGTGVRHLAHDGRTSDHRVTDGVRVLDGHLRYDGGQEPLTGPDVAP